MEVKEIILNSIYEMNIILIPRSDKDITRKENYKSGNYLYFMHIDAKILNKNTGSLNQIMY
jgi:hypothetical protein